MHIVFACIVLCPGLSCNWHHIDSHSQSVRCPDAPMPRATICMRDARASELSDSTN